jgi:ABC-type sugar transport system ATPase subunit
MDAIDPAHGLQPASGTAISLRGVTVAFGTVLALRGVDVDVGIGGIHAFVGQNGAGKSTCLGVIAGRFSPTAGTVELFGRPAPIGDPRAVSQAGVGIVYQELTTLPALSTQANLFLGNPIARRGVLLESAMRDRLAEMCAELEIQIPPNVPAGRLSVADQQMLEIMRVLNKDSRIVAFDEPTASLAEHERETLFRVMRQMQARGVTIVLVSHNLDEVLAISDRITVFRDGSVAADRSVTDWDKPSLVEAMLGEAGSRKQASERSRVEHADIGAEVIRVEGLTVPGAVADISFSVREHEILGIGGLVGSGRTTVLRALAGLEPRATGRLWLRGRECGLPRSPRAALKLGVALIPEDRKRAGVIGTRSAADNVVLANVRGASEHGVVTNASVTRAAAPAAIASGFSEGRLGVPADTLSGGNQQKLLFARWTYRPAKILLADEPTRGIDIGAKSDIAQGLRDHADAGAAVILVSSDLEEVVDVCDRCVVLSEGRFAGEIDAAEGLTVDRILARAFRLSVETSSTTTVTT